MPEDARNQRLNLCLLHSSLSALQFTTQIHCSSGLALAEAANKTNPRNTGPGWEFINALHRGSPCFLPSRSQLHLSCDSPRCVVNLKIYPSPWPTWRSTEPVISEPTATENLRPFHAGNNQGEEGECLQTATASVVKSEVSPLHFRA